MDERWNGTVAESVERSRKYVGSLLHGLMILDMFSRERPEISIGDMALAVGVHKSSASRLAATLAHAGYLAPTRIQGTYKLGGRLRALGHLTTQSFDLVGVVLPHLERLSRSTGETGHLGVLRDGVAHTEAVTEGWHTIRMHSWVGKASPAYVSSMGKALLAGLDDADLRRLYDSDEFERFTPHTVPDVDALVVQIQRLRERGYGVDDEELEIGMRCVSAPLVSGSGTIVASISISGPAQRISREVVRELSEHVRWHAAAASRDLGARSGVPDGWPPPPEHEPPPLSYLTQRRTR